MTRPHHRHLRVIWTGDAPKPWIVQSCSTGNNHGHAWEDILRFRQPIEATRYVEEISQRDQKLEAER